ncbi:L,D-transpeptidase family protein [Xanthobacter sp. KR7-65]|uniref:L,D-transpeptidase family protein n=1 Tax=Xanthobacter sp. KR7-65 TaxID=3156612 RepID=UPI0032B35C63
MTLRNTFLLAAFGASVLTAPALGQGAYGTRYSLPAAGEEETGTLPPGSVGGYGEAPPGYSDPYARQAPVRRDQVERTELPPPGPGATYAVPAAPQPYPQQAYPQPAYPPQQGYPQPVQPNYARAPMGVPAEAGPAPIAVVPEGQQAYGGQPPYNTPPDLYGRQPAPASYEPPQQVYGQPAGAQPGYGQQAYGGSGRGAVDQDALYASLNAGPPPAGVYGPNSAVVPGTTEAPSGPRIENIDPTEPVPERFRRQTVDYVTTQPAGTIVIDTPNTYLYYVLGGGKAIRYGIGVGREGFTWAGTEKITAKKEWADWRPPSEMIERQPYLPRFMAGGPGNPLGARTMYLGGTVYRIHGTNEPQTIGKFVSSGCFRMLNADVEDLYDRAKVGTKVVILPKSGTPQANAGSGPVSTAAAGKPAAQR